MSREPPGGAQGKIEGASGRPPASEPASPSVGDVERLAQLLLPLASPLRLQILRYLTRPRYLEEIASHLGLARQSVRRHLDMLVEIGALERRPGLRPGGHVTEYVVHPQSLYLIYDEFEKLASLRPSSAPAGVERTVSLAGPRAGIPAPGTPHLSIVRGLHLGSRFPFYHGHPPAWRLGRDAACDLVLDHDPYVSNRHAEIRREGTGLVLVDLHSTNGTYHNWQPLPPGGRTALFHGDLVGVGGTLLLFRER